MGFPRPARLTREQQRTLARAVRVAVAAFARVFARLCSDEVHRRRRAARKGAR